MIKSSVLGSDVRTWRDKDFICPVVLSGETTFNEYEKINNQYENGSVRTHNHYARKRVSGLFFLNEEIRTGMTYLSSP